MSRPPGQAAAPLRFPAVTGHPGVLVYWHLLSLDAPTVATLWTWFLGVGYGVALSPASLATMFLAVWLLYAGDRVLDAQTPLLFSGTELEARHRFHGEHRSLFLWGIAAAAAALAFLLPRLATPVLHLYLVEGSFLAGYFLVLHGSRKGHRLPKEFAVGLFFSAAVFIPIGASHPELQRELLLQAALFGALCTLNGLYIYAWEHPLAASPTIHTLTRLALRYLVTLNFALLSASIADAFVTTRLSVPLAIALACVAHLVLDASRRRLTRLTLRALADSLLLTPVVVYAVATLWNA